MSKNCLVTQLKESVSDNSLLKLGEIKVKIYPSPTSTGYGSFSMGSTKSGDKVSISGAYFCKTKNSDTPLNGTIEDSKEVTLTPTHPGNMRYNIKFQEDYAILTVKNKYNFLGIGNDANDYDKNFFVNYDITEEDLRYCPMWCAFTSKHSVPYPTTFPSGAIISANSYDELDITGISLGSAKFGTSKFSMNGRLYINNCKGTLNGEMRANTIYLKGEFFWNIEENNLVCQNSTFLSPNIYGNISNIKQPSGSPTGYLHIGYCPLTSTAVKANNITITEINQPLATIQLSIASDIIGYVELAKILVAENNESVRDSVSIRIKSDSITASGALADSACSQAISNLKAAKTSAILYINGTIV